MTVTALSSIRSAIVLAGGNGRHVRLFVRQLQRIDLPKQYVAFIGRRSLLEHTWHRIERAIPANRVHTVLTQDHLQYSDVRRQLALRDPQTVIIQPANRESVPGLMLALMRLHKQYPNSSVAVFPSDHFILQEDLFAAHVIRAFETVEEFPNRILFLGAEPSNPEAEYGYILPEPATSDRRDLSIKALVEEPEPRLAAQMISMGALWNTMVMIFKSGTFLDLVKQSAPELLSAFERIARFLGTSRESSTIAEVYREMKPLELCKDLMNHAFSDARTRESRLSWTSSRQL